MDKVTPIEALTALDSLDTLIFGTTPADPAVHGPSSRGLEMANESTILRVFIQNLIDEMPVSETAAGDE